MIQVKENQAILSYHLAYTLHLELDILKLLATSYPETVQEQNYQGWLAFHLVAGKADATKWLLGEYLDAHKHESKEGDLPLHIIHQRKALDNMLELVLSACSQSPLNACCMQMVRMVWFPFTGLLSCWWSQNMHPLVSKY
jgi:hypothetical protein